MKVQTPHQSKVEEFMYKAGQEVPEGPIVPSFAVRKLRATLILEEALETINGLGFYAEVVAPPIGTRKQVLADLSLTETGLANLVEIVDGCADLSVVAIGTLSACGVADRDVLEEVNEANLRKFGPGGYRREDGKWIKPKDWQPPDIGGCLSYQVEYQ